ncbi:uncharacterized protein LOC123296941 isoform X2 [Chrysoperla carnea]|uniref:uncharacterized protein LOC123296941 isoform X2 n=1 Tax=Chrysoperla carnea TaxID=189513 RepID=UPI001D07BC79|nr:uncharacterized protein LOC123296941 isoform X2 [Chrysoperla carnea]
MFKSFSSRDLEYEWSMLPKVDHEWSAQDLQLAAELGNTLLERNKELEKSLRQHQNIIEDQAQEIEYLNKQTAALREVNDSRLRIYEQLEVSIQDLERSNHRLALDNTNDKKQIKSLLSNIETLEEKCEELQKNLDDVTRQLNLTRRHQQKCITIDQSAITASSPNTNDTIHTDKLRLRLKAIHENGSTNQDSLPTSQENQIKCDSTTSIDTTDNGIMADPNNAAELNEEIMQLLKELADERAQRTRDQRRVTELEEQMTSLLHQIQALEQQLTEYHQKEVMTSMHEEISTLEEVREGHLCARCLRNVDERARDELSSLLDQESVVYEDDNMQSMNNSIINEIPYRSTISLDIQDSHNKDAADIHATENDKTNPYRVLVEKYEALLQVDRQRPNRICKRNPPPTKSLSLQEELQMSGDFNSLSTKDTDDESGHGGDSFKLNSNNKTVNPRKHRKTFSRTPTDFSEAETSSSGFSDETSNKATQTDWPRPGSFLCTIADGEDCKFSIYDDGSPIDSRFRNHPEYRELFKEIFSVLKKAAENKDEGEQLPLLDDAATTNPVPKVPPVTPQTEDAPSDFTDDCQSVTSCTNSEMSTTLMETHETIPEKRAIEKVETLKTELEIAQPLENKTEIRKPEEPLILKPYKREPLEYNPGGLRKKSSSRKNGLRKSNDRSESPVLPLSSPKITYSTRGNAAKNGRRRDFKPLETPLRALTETSPEWNGNSMQFWSSNRNLTSPSQYEIVQPSPASQDLIKLKNLDFTYAEVLRNADKKKTARMNNHRRK